MSAVRERQDQPAERDERFELLVDSPLLRGLSQEQLDDFFALSTVVSIDRPGAVIVREGEDSENIYMILSGRAEVTKREEDREFPLASLGPGDHFGETALFEGSKRTASIRAQTPMDLLMIQTRPLRAAPGDHSWLAGFLLNLAREGSSRLDRLTHQTVVSLRAESDGNDRALGFGQTLTYVVASLATYSIGVAASASLARAGWIGGFAQALISHGLVLALALTLVLVMRSSGYPRQFFGLRLAKDWRRDLRDGLGAAAVMIAAMTLVKLVLIRAVPALRGFELFEASLIDGGQALFAFCYVALIPVQELCARGGLQGAIEESLRGQAHRTRHAIILASALLAAVHAHISPVFALAVFATSLVWGTLFSRSRSLIGVTIGHVLVAAWVLRVLGFGQLLVIF